MVNYPITEGSYILPCPSSSKNNRLSELQYSGGLVENGDSDQSYLADVNNTRNGKNDHNQPFKDNNEVAMGHPVDFVESSKESVICLLPLDFGNDRDNIVDFLAAISGARIVCVIRFSCTTRPQKEDHVFMLLVWQV